jgi:hypothetical protein
MSRSPVKEADSTERAKKSERISVMEFYKKYILRLGLINEEEFFQL